MVNYHEEFMPKFIFDEFEVISETENTYLIQYQIFKKRVLKSQDGKRFAYSTKEAAVNGFLHKRLRYHSILNSKLKGNSIVIEIAKRMAKDVNYIHDFSELLNT